MNSITTFRLGMTLVVALILSAASGAAVAETTLLVSEATDGVPGNGGSTTSSISANGRYVLFNTTADNLVPDGLGGGLLVRDRETGINHRVNIRAYDGGSANGSIERPQISGNGQLIIFRSDANNLVAGDTEEGLVRKGVGARREIRTSGPGVPYLNVKQKEFSASDDRESDNVAASELPRSFPSVGRRNGHQDLLAVG